MYHVVCHVKMAIELFKPFGHACEIVARDIVQNVKAAKRLRNVETNVSGIFFEEVQKNTQYFEPRTDPSPFGYPSLASLD